MRNEVDSKDSLGSSEPARLAIIGWEEGLAGQVSGWLEQHCNYRIALYVHPADSPPAINAASAAQRPAKRFDVPSANSYKGIALLSASDFAPQLMQRGISAVAICLSESAQRQKCYEYLKRTPALRVINCIHPSAVILADVELGEGLIIEPNCYVGYRAEIGNCVHLHAGAQADHHSVIRDYATLNPAATLAGNVLIGEHTVVHTNATVINRINIGPHNVIGAGAVVIADHPGGGDTLAGVPARVIRSRS